MFLYFHPTNFLIEHLYMPDQLAIYPIITTKLHRHPVGESHVHRPRLLERLDQHQQMPFTLVSAPAGYGKSVLISCWLESCDIPGAWVSLDEKDNDLRTFLSYFIAAVDTLFPGACRDTLTMLNPPDLPSMETLCTSLLNQLDLIEHSFTLVLDDFHRIVALALRHDH